MGQTTDVHWVVFDVGEVLIDETRVWETWARVLGVPAFTVSAVIGASVAAGGDHRDAFARLGFTDWAQYEAEFEARYGGFDARDLYPDVLPALAALRDAGLRVAVIGNQPAVRGAQLRALGVAPDVMAMSEELGVEKPDPAFFARVLELVQAEPERTAYVGDRVDNDVVPALQAGLRAIWLRRGPWGALHTLPAGVTAVEARDLREVVLRVTERRAG